MDICFFYDPNMPTDYGIRLKKARIAAGLTQTQLSKKTDIPQSTISTAERIGNGSSETVTYALACGVDANWLANGVGGFEADQENAQPPANHASASEVTAALGALLRALDLDARERIAALLVNLAREPDGLWGGWLATLIEHETLKRSTADRTNESKVGVTQLSVSPSVTPVLLQSVSNEGSATQRPPTPNYNLGTFDTSKKKQPKNASHPNRRVQK